MTIFKISTKLPTHIHKSPDEIPKLKKLPKRKIKIMYLRQLQIHVIIQPVKVHIDFDLFGASGVPQLLMGEGEQFEAVVPDEVLLLSYELAVREGFICTCRRVLVIKVSRLWGIISGRSVSWLL
jgi:hypothetical protein